MHFPASPPRAILIAFLFSLAAAMTTGPVNAQEDDRQFVKVAPDVMNRFLAEMREDLVHLDDLLGAIAAGDMEQAARIAERRMGLGHQRLMRMQEQGASDEEINRMVAKIRKMAVSEGVDLPKALHGKKHGGIGMLMPEELRAMGQEMHKAAYHLADVARAAKNPPDAGDYRKLFAAVNDITTQCRGCHETFRVR